MQHPIRSTLPARSPTVVLTCAKPSRSMPVPQLMTRRYLDNSAAQRRMERIGIEGIRPLMLDSVADWTDGRRIDVRGRKKVLRAAGVLSRTGDAARQLGGFSRWLERTRGFVPGDFLEVTYRGRLNGAEWVPCAYEATDCDVPLAQSRALVARQLRWYDTLLPADLELHLIGYSL